MKEEDRFFFISLVSLISMATSVFVMVNTWNVAWVEDIPRDTQVSEYQLDLYAYKYSDNIRRAIDSVGSKIVKLEETIKIDNPNYELVTMFDITVCHVGYYAEGCMHIGTGDSDFVDDVTSRYPKSMHRVEAKEIYSEYMRKDGKDGK